jgi:hypothetical protein
VTRAYAEAEEILDATLVKAFEFSAVVERLFDSSATAFLDVRFRRTDASRCASIAPGRDTSAATTSALEYDRRDGARNSMNLADSSSLKAELEYFEQHRLELLRRAQGKFALIKAHRVVDTFDNQSDAIRAGYHEFGNEPFLVKQIVAVDVPLNFTSFNVGV